MIVDIGWVVMGLVLLVVGGDALVRGASGVALLAKVTPAVIGLTIVAAGTSMPELVVSVQSALRNSPGIAVGNVIGSNIFNIGAILGLAALIRPLRIQSNTIRLEWPVMMLAAIQMFLLSRDGVLDRLEGTFLLFSMLAFTIYAVYLGRSDVVLEKEVASAEMATASFGRAGRTAVVFNVLAILAGVGLLAAGSSALVEGAVGLASGFGVSETIIGLTIVAAGTSTPELLTSLVASRRGQDDIAIGNIVGSNIFNVLGIAGMTAVVLPLEVSEELIRRDAQWMMGFSLVLLPLMKSGMRVSRREGALLFSAYVVYTITLVQAARAVL